VAEITVSVVGSKNPNWFDTHQIPKNAAYAIPDEAATRLMTASLDVWDVRVGRFVFDRKDDPSTGSVDTPSRFDRVTGVFSGAPQAFGGLLLKRTTAKATVTHFQPQF
jgi:hypothetical protein